MTRLRKFSETLAEVDVDALRSSMAATIERAKADDPRELRKRITELERQVAQKPVPASERIVEVPVLTDEERSALRSVERSIADHLEIAANELATLRAFVERKLAAVDPNYGRPIGRSSTAHTQDRALALSARSGRGNVAAAPPSHRNSAPSASAASAGISGPQQRILDALAQLESVRVPEALKTQLALFASASPTSSAFSNNLGEAMVQGGRQ